MKKGESVFIRTVTYHYVGRVTRITRSWIHLEDASWVADSGRFGAALTSGNLDEVEHPADGRVKLSRAGLIDVWAWNHSLPVLTR